VVTKKSGVLIGLARKLPESESDQYRFWEFAESPSTVEGLLCLPDLPSAALTIYGWSTKETTR
jgi:hypothetical protein